jgi:carboxypeptidase family protein
VRGLLRDSVSRTPLPGAFLTLVDEHGVERARTMTNAAGEFTLTAPGAGIYRLRSKRIGFRPLVSATLTLRAGEVMSYNAAIDPIPISLQEVVVAGDRQCDIESGAGASVAAVWDEVHEALAAVAWTSRVPSYWFELTRFQRHLTVSGRRQGPDSTWGQTGFSINPIRNETSPALLETEGYVVTDSTGWTYRAPDSDVLLSDAFLRTHCFETEAGEGENQGLVGLQFTPARDRTVPEITGTLWVDRRTSELRLLAFRYVHLPDEVVSQDAGGRIEFLRLPSGVWIVRDWVIRMPLTRMKQQPMAMGVRPEVFGFVETGGSAATIKANDGRLVFGSSIASAPTTVPQVATPAAPDTARSDTGAAAASSKGSRSRARNSNVIARPEIDSSTAVDAYALIQESRPMWLHNRGTISITDPTAGNVQVYRDGAPLGDVDRLHEIPTNGVREIHLLEPAQAEMRYGAGHAGGIIEVVTAAGAPAPAAAGQAVATKPPTPAEVTLSDTERHQRRMRNSNILKADEFANTTAMDALALVQEFRPNWLHSRGAVSILQPHAGDLQVYINGIASGDVSRLQEIAVMDIRELRFLGAGDAQLRYGVGHAGGVIEVFTK